MVGVVGTGLAFALYYRIMQTIGPARTSVVGVPDPGRRRGVRGDPAGRADRRRDRDRPRADPGRVVPDGPSFSRPCVTSSRGSLRTSGQGTLRPLRHPDRRGPRRAHARRGSSRRPRSSAAAASSSRRRCWPAAAARPAASRSPTTRPTRRRRRAASSASTSRATSRAACGSRRRSRSTREYYFSITFDRGAKATLFMLSTMGGMDIEAVAVDHPDKLARIHLEPGDRPAAVLRAPPAVRRRRAEGRAQRASRQLIAKAYEMFTRASTPCWSR